MSKSTKPIRSTLGFECSVCWDLIDQKKIVKCFCGFTVCVSCTKQMILLSIKLPFCPECKRLWTTKFLINMLPKSWVVGTKPNQYRHHYKKTLIDRERSLFTETIAEFERKKLVEKKRKDVRVLLIPIDRECSVLYHENFCIKLFIKQIGDNTKILTNTRARVTKIYPFIKRKRVSTIKKDCLVDIKKDLVKRTDKYLELAEARRLLNEKYHNMGGTVGNYAYVCPCPKDSCRGMINKTNFQCAVCKVVVCERCYDILGEGEKGSEKEKGSENPGRKSLKNHKCDPSALKTVKLIKKSTRPCPSCATPIYKISGCDQMFCTECKTPFRWRSGIIETGVIHNPHALEWLRKNGSLNRNQNDVVCGGLVQWNRLTNLLSDQIGNCYGICMDIENIYRRVGEGSSILNELRRTVGTRIRDLRHQFLFGSVDEEKWKRMVFLNDRKDSRIRERINILETFVNIGIETFRDLTLKLEEISKSNWSVSKRETCKSVAAKFIQRMIEVKKFINHTFIEEMVILGTKNHHQIDYLYSLKFAYFSS